jgi:hypothetical protein
MGWNHGPFGEKGLVWGQDGQVRACLSPGGT